MNDYSMLLLELIPTLLSATNLQAAVPGIIIKKVFFVSSYFMFRCSLRQLEVVILINFILAGWNCLDFNELMHF